MRLNYNKIFDQLYPLNRSITGEGYRKSLKIGNIDNQVYNTSTRNT